MSNKTQRRAHIAIVGAGFTGLVCALHLINAGYQVTLLEGGSHVGGLTGTQDFKLFRWDRFYHCILTSDSHLLALLKSIGLSDQLKWSTTEVGFFSHNQLYTMTSPADLLRFPHLTLWSKLRFALGTLYAAKICNGNGLEEVSLETWTKKIFGKDLYREIWEPLFRCKLGETRKIASAAFLWGTLRRLYSTREKGSSKKERLGYVKGGYAKVFERLVQVLEVGGADIHTGVKVERIGLSADKPDGAHHLVEVQSSVCSETYDGAIITLPNRFAAACMDTPDLGYAGQLEKIFYLGLVCVVLVLCRQLSPYYVTNITEESQFTGIIEMTNLIDKDTETSGFHLIYLPRYTTPGDPLFSATDTEVWQVFEPQLRRIHPDLANDDIIARFVFREKTVQPVPTLRYSQIVPSTHTPLKRVYLVNTSQIENNTLNNNVMAELAERACKTLIGEIPAIVDCPTRELVTHTTIAPQCDTLEVG